MSGLKDKVVVITGASSGIGAGTAIHFASLGCKLVIAGRNEENLKGVSKKCLENGLSADKVSVLVGDVTDEPFCEKLIDHSVNTFGKIDVLVNSAGILVSGGIEQIDIKDYDRQMNVNVRSIFLLTKLALPHILVTKGNVVNVSSVTGMRSFPGVLAYNMSKAAVDHFTRSVALEVASRGVRVNAVNPGVIVTECHRRAGMNEEDYAKVDVSIGDVSEHCYCEKLMKQAVNSFGRLDVLVNAAGILLGGGIEQLTLEEYNYQMNVNVTSIFSLTKLALPLLIESKGNIVNVSSVTGLRAFPGVVGYNVSKAAVDHLTRSVALEAAPYGVRVNAVNPGVIITNLHRRGGMDEETYVKFLEHCKQTHALGRPGTTEEVAKAIAFLASDDSSFITGATLPVDGGRNIMCPR